MTLEHLEVDLGKCFDAGQAYVTMSRATSLHSTRVLSFNPETVRAHEVVRYYQALEEQSQLERQQPAGSASAAGPASVASRRELGSSSGGGMTSVARAHGCESGGRACATRAAQRPGAS